MRHTRSPLVNELVPISEFWDSKKVVSKLRSAYRCLNDLLVSEPLFHCHWCQFMCIKTHSIASPPCVATIKLVELHNRPNKNSVVMMKTLPTMKLSSKEVNKSPLFSKKWSTLYVLSSFLFLSVAYYHYVNCNVSRFA